MNLESENLRVSPGWVSESLYDKKPNEPIYLGCRFLICQWDIIMFTSQGCWVGSGEEEKQVRGHVWVTCNRKVLDG